MRVAVRRREGGLAVCLVVCCERWALWCARIIGAVLIRYLGAWRVEGRDLHLLLGRLLWYGR
jgi:hypothetical protein